MFYSVLYHAVQLHTSNYQSKYVLRMHEETYQSHSPKQQNDQIIILFLWANFKGSPHEGLQMGHQPVTAPHTNKTLSHYTRIDYS